MKSHQTDQSRSGGQICPNKVARGVVSNSFHLCVAEYAREYIRKSLEKLAHPSFCSVCVLLKVTRLKVMFWRILLSVARRIAFAWNCDISERSDRLGGTGFV